MSLISIAQAAPAGEAASAAHDVSFFANPESWVAIAFLVVIALLARPVCRLLCAALDQRGEKIKARIDEAENLADEAQKLLVAFQKKQHESAKEVEAILKQARIETEYNAKQGLANLEEVLARREAQALERLEQAEMEALREVRNATIDIAIEAARELMSSSINAKQAAGLIDDTIKDLPKRLH